MFGTEHVYLSPDTLLHSYNSIYYLLSMPSIDIQTQVFLHSSVTISIRNVYFHFIVGAYIIYVLMIVFDVFHCFPM